jgi:molecular chaperone GrpE
MKEEQVDYGSPMNGAADEAVEVDGGVESAQASAGGAGGHPDLPAESGGAGGEAAGENDNLVLESLRADFDELNDRHIRLAAEFNNYRRRAERESLGTWGRAQADLLKKFLDVLDDLHRVAALDPDEESVTVQSIVEGIDLVERKFLRALEDAGTELVDPAPGSLFDPESMEAMMRVPAEDPDLDDQVAQVFHKGYRVDGNLVRPARVSVYKAD